MNAEQIRQARAMLTRPDESVPSIARRVSGVREHPREESRLADG